jgi:hypothetical protein
MGGARLLVQFIALLEHLDFDAAFGEENAEQEARGTRADDDDLLRHAQYLTTGINCMYSWNLVRTIHLRTFLMAMRVVSCCL